MIGIYGGSFDPVHIGHLRLAEDVRESFGFAQVVFVPAFISPFKEKSFAGAEDRINMLKISLKYNPFFSLSVFEIEKKGKSYTVDTIKHFLNVYKQQPLFFILGSDAFLSLHRWKSADELVNLTNFVVVLRNGADINQIKEYIQKHFPQKKLKTYSQIDTSNTGFYLFTGRKIDVSSTEIRKRVKEGKSITYLVLPEVEQYIKKKNLYRGEKAPNSL